MLFVPQFTIHISEFIIKERRIVACGRKEKEKTKRNMGE